MIPIIKSNSCKGSLLSFLYITNFFLNLKLTHALLKSVHQGHVLIISLGLVAFLIIKPVVEYKI